LSICQNFVKLHTPLQNTKSKDGRDLGVVVESKIKKIKAVYRIPENCQFFHTIDLKGRSIIKANLNWSRTRAKFCQLIAWSYVFIIISFFFVLKLE